MRRVGVDVSRSDAKPEPTECREGPIDRYPEAKTDPEAGASITIQQEAYAKLEIDRLQHQVREFVPSLFVEKEECREERAKVDAEKQVLVRIGAPATGKYEPGDIRDEESRLSHDRDVGFTRDPGRSGPHAQRQGQAAIPPAIEPISASLRSGRATKRRKDQDRADDHPQPGVPCHYFPMHWPAWRVKN